MSTTYRLPPPPWRGRVFNALGEAKRLLRREPYLDRDHLIEWTTDAYGLDDFGETFQFELLDLILDDARRTDLTFIGRRGLSQLLGLCLGMRLMHIEARKRHPEIFTAPPRTPLIVLGPPRSGTTLLHRLLALHPDQDAIANWELLRPVTPALLGTPGPDRRRQWMLADEERRMKYRPTSDHIHFERADTPGECILLLFSTLRSYAFIGYAPFYGYMEHMRTTDGFPQYRDYAELLQLLQHPRPGRSMVLKAPSHSAYLGEILSVMPQARIVTTYRDFSTVATSLLSLYRAQFGASTRSYDAREHALKVLELMRADGLAYAEARARHRDDFHDVFYADLVGDPVGTVRSIYESFDIDWPDGHEDRIDRYLKANPKGKHGRHRYSAEDFGITEQEIVDYVGPVAEAVLAAPSGR